MGMNGQILTQYWIKSLFFLWLLDDIVNILFLKSWYWEKLKYVQCSCSNMFMFTSGLGLNWFLDLNRSESIPSLREQPKLFRPHRRPTLMDARMHFEARHSIVTEGERLLQSFLPSLIRGPKKAFSRSSRSNLVKSADCFKVLISNKWDFFVLSNSSRTYSPQTLIRHH